MVKRSSKGQSDMVLLWFRSWKSFLKCLLQLPKCFYNDRLTLDGTQEIFARDTRRVIQVFSCWWCNRWCLRVWLLEGCISDDSKTISQEVISVCYCHQRNYSAKNFSVSSLRVRNRKVVWSKTDSCSWVLLCWNLVIFGSGLQAKSMTYDGWHWCSARIIWVCDACSLF